MLEVYQLTNHLRLKKILILFDCYIGGVVNYVSEIWGDTERAKCWNFCKQLLGVKRTTCSSAVYTELGRYPLSIYRMNNIIKYWKYVLDSDNCIIVACYKILFDNCEIFGRETGYILLRNMCQDFFFWKLGFTNHKQSIFIIYKTTNFL